MKRLFYLIILFLLFGCNTNNIEFDFENNIDNFNNSLITVHIKGAVKLEGIYMIESNKLLNDLVEKAGGFTSDADTSNINLARPLTSNEMIIIPRIKENQEVIKTENSTLININTATFKELDSLPGIGEKLANKIIDSRTTEGYFVSTDDLKIRKILSNGEFEKIKELITI